MVIQTAKNRLCRIARRPGVQLIVPLSRPVLGPSGGSRQTTGLLPGFYRPVECHYRISPRFSAIGCEALQKGFETLESPLVTGFYAAF